MKSNYTSLIAYKKWFADTFSNQFNGPFLGEAPSFLREMFLDPSECENASYLLPSLRRDSFQKKNNFYRLEKIIIDIHSG
jgi:hypothetical protein